MCDSNSRLVFFVDSREMRGAQRALLNYAAANLESGSPTTVVCFGKPKGTERFDLVELSSGSILKPQNLLYCLICLLKNDVAVSTIPHVNIVIGFLCLFSYKTKLIWRESNSVEVSYSRRMFRNIAQVLVWLLKRRISVVIPSRHLEKEYFSLYPFLRNQIFVVSNGIGFGQWCEAHGRCSLLETGLGSYFVVSLRDAPQKNVEATLCCSEQLLMTLPHLKCVVLGESAHPMLKRLKKDWGDRFFYKGFVNDPSLMVSACSFAICLSLEEGNPNFVNEALSLGVPIVLLERPWSREYNSFSGVFIISDPDPGPIMDELRLCAQSTVTYTRRVDPTWAQQIRKLRDVVDQ